LGTFCDVGTETCKPAPGVGKLCELDVDHRCAANAYCDADSMRCKARRGDGLACREGEQCSSLYCDPKKLRCVKRPPVRPCPF
jgi:hypothetical protein